jgi:hypothetical protein
VTSTRQSAPKAPTRLRQRSARASSPPRESLFRAHLCTPCVARGALRAGRIPDGQEAGVFVPLHAQLPVW